MKCWQYMSLSVYLGFLYMYMLFFFTRDFHLFNQDNSFFYHEASLDAIPYVYFHIIGHTFIPSYLYKTFIRCHRRGPGVTKRCRYLG